MSAIAALLLLLFGSPAPTQVPAQPDSGSNAPPPVNG